MKGVKKTGQKQEIWNLDEGIIMTKHRACACQKWTTITVWFDAANLDLNTTESVASTRDRCQHDPRCKVEYRLVVVCYAFVGARENLIRLQYSLYSLRSRACTRPVFVLAPETREILGEPVAVLPRPASFFFECLSRLSHWIQRGCSRSSCDLS